jgi:hypothetical protein
MLDEFRDLFEFAISQLQANHALNNALGGGVAIYAFLELPNLACSATVFGNTGRGDITFVLTPNTRGLSIVVRSPEFADCNLHYHCALYGDNSVMFRQLN